MLEGKLTRRTLIRSAMLSSATMLVAACAPKVIKETVVVKEVVKETVEVEKVVKEAVEVEKEVTRVVEKEVVVEAGRDIFQGDLTLWHPWGTGFEGGAYPFLKNSEHFPSLHPGVVFHNVYDATIEKRLAALAAGNPPDLMLLSAPDIPELAQRGALTVLDPLIERDNYDMTQFWPMALEQCSWRDKTYAISHHPDIRLMYYDKTVMEDVGLDPDGKVGSWDDLYEWGKAMSKEEGGRYTRFGWVPTWNSGPWANHYMVANGVQRLDDDGHTATFNTPEAEEALEYVVRCTDDVCGGRDNVEEFLQVNVTPDGTGVYWMFPYHLVGMVDYGNWMVNAIYIVDPDQPVGYGSLPGGPSNPNTTHVFHGGTMVAIPQQAKHWELAWEFLKYMDSQDYGNGAQFIQAAGDDIAGNIAEATSEEAMQYPGRREVIELFKEADSPSYLRSPISRQWDDELNRMGERILLKEETISEALTSTQDAVQKALDEFWASV